MTTVLERPARRKTADGDPREFSRWHEDCMEHLLRESNASVYREPLLSGKTPDLLVTPERGKPFIVECIARLPDPGHAREMARTGRHVCNGNIRALHANVYSRLDSKVTKYRQIAEGMPYVIALYDGGCLNSLETAVDMAMSPYQPTIDRAADGTVQGRSYNTLWSSQEIPGALFELYPHLSGLVYSRWPRQHYFLPNPNAEQPLDPGSLPFATVPSLPAGYRPERWNPRAATAVDRSPEPPGRWAAELRQTSDANLHQLHAA